MTKEKISEFSKAILAGFCISIGCIVNLKVGGVAGAVLFSFGLLTVVHYGYLLYTGKAGFFDRKHDKRFLLMVLTGNIVGCALFAMMARYATPEIVENATTIFQSRLHKGPAVCFFLAIGCGFIMTVAVRWGREKQYLPLLFGVPVFILCGFAHSIADAFYFLLQPAADLLQWNVALIYLAEVVGNLVGCNIYRLIDPLPTT